jgi:cyclopropane-fatty-acyl-phospholipid synthase
MARETARTIAAIDERFRPVVTSGTAVPFRLRFADGSEHRLGDADPAFTLSIHNDRGMAAVRSLDRMRACEAFFRGDLDVEGDFLALVSLRDVFSDRHPVLSAGRFVTARVLGQITSDKRSIAKHYDYGPEFYLLFLDSRHRCYSQAVFARDDEPLEDAVRRKLDYAIEATGLRPGDHVLDIGGGWGAFLEYAGKQGIRVTSITISRDSAAFLQSLVDRHRLPGRVLLEHLFEHRPAERYDAIVNMGVTEHLPDYRRTLATYQSLIRPGGRIYLDASANRRKYAVSSLVLRHIYPGNGSLLCLHRYLAELARTPLRLTALHDDRHSYYLTARHWAEKLERNRGEIERRWGPELFRKFQLYLWGVAGGMEMDMLQAYRLVLEAPAR